MKTVGIITISKVNNYGAELQAFALQHKLRIMGYDAEIIDYLFYKNRNHIPEAVSKPFYPYPLMRRLKEFLLPKVEWFRTLAHRHSRVERELKFEAFHRKNTKFSNRQYARYSELYENVPDYDVYCVGSDQVWNPNCYTSLNPYMLTFAPSGKRKISYASSFGVSEIPRQAVDQYKKGLSELSYISVREKTGCQIVSELTGKEGVLVLDPTLLLEKSDWDTVANSSSCPKKPYLLLYVLRDSDYITQLAQCLAKSHGYKVVRICKNAYVQDKRKTEILNVIDAGPDEFVGFFRNASLVLTNSFHGTVFSILYQKEFYSIVPVGKDNNSRQIDLLMNLDLGERILGEKTKFEEKRPIDYSIVGVKITSLREKSMEYLKKAIED